MSFSDLLAACASTDTCETNPEDIDLNVIEKLTLDHCKNAYYDQRLVQCWWVLARQKYTTTEVHIAVLSQLVLTHGQHDAEVY